MSNLKRFLDSTNFEDAKLLQPFLHYASTPGKKIRSKFIKNINNVFKIPEKKMEEIEEICEELHNTSLIYDDIEDRSELRRGVPAAHLVYGTHSTLNAARFVSLKILEEVVSFDNPKSTDILINRLLDLHKGQGIDLYWRDYFICPTMEEYKLMCSLKNSALFLFGAESMQVFSSYKTDHSDFVNKFGICFQIWDDYMNLCSDEYAANKDFCDDIAEGKFSFPIIHAIQSRPEDKRILDILKQETKDLKTRQYCLSLLKEFGSLDCTKCVFEEMKEELKREMEKFSTELQPLEIFDSKLSY